MSADVEPSELVYDRAPRLRFAPVRPRLGNAVMRGATRINWAEPELRGLGAFVRPGDVVFDVGAAHGMYTIPLSHYVGPRGRVLSFDPHPRQQGQLRFLKGLLGTRQVTVIPGAVGDEPGDFSMRLPYKYGFPIYGHAHITKEPIADLVSTSTVKYYRTPVYTIDSWCEAEKIDRVSFMKVDVEGFEPSVVGGAAATIDRSRPTMLLEIEDRHLVRYDRTADGFADEIRSRWPEYRMYTFQGEDWVPTPHIAVETRNYLFATDAAFDR